MNDIDAILAEELRYFDSDRQRASFGSARVAPVPCPQSWQYSDEIHNSIVVARDDTSQIVYCPTGSGPDFPWSLQPLGSNDLGSDDQWYAYLYEAFVTSNMWPDDTPDGFVLMARGERRL